MRLRIKHTFHFGEVTSIAGSVDNPLIELTMPNGSVLYYPQEQLTNEPPFNYIWLLLERLKIYLTP